MIKIIMSETLDLPVEEFAKWLIERAPDRLWSVEGEDQLEEKLSLPCTGRELAAELTKRGGCLRFSGPTDPSAKPDRDLGVLSSVAYGKGDEIIFRAAWVDDERNASGWLIVTDVLAEEATRSAHAS
jgi:hypothetical protein